MMQSSAPFVVMGGLPSDFEAAAVVSRVMRWALIRECLCIRVLRAFTIRKRPPQCGSIRAHFVKRAGGSFGALWHCAARQLLSLNPFIARAER